ncbi:hypothetical protein F5X98DRAFT_341130 [Xylaria grammica]|nr:hypothetical protein F5X98DRAFT_341130 [Xylaria grammica]
MNTGTMNADAWVQEYQRPFVKRKNVECHSGHLHQSNVPAAGFVLVRLNASSELEVLLELRSRTVSQPNTYGCIGGFAATKGEEAIDTAYREAKEEFGIEKDLR